MDLAMQPRGLIRSPERPSPLTPFPEKRSPHRKANRQRGYLMLSLMLFMALLAIAMLAVLPDIKQQINRDREEEMIHRGSAYMRAIQHYYRKLGRYPTRLEDLENTNNVRYLRKRYTDPMNIDPKTGKERDFKFLHQQDISLNNGPALGTVQNGAPPPGGIGGNNSPFGGLQPGGGAQGGLGGFGSPQSGLGGLNQPNTSSQNSNNSSSSGSSDGSSSSSGNSSDSGQSSQGSSSSGSSSPGTGMFGSTFGASGQTMGGGPILGVSSQSKSKSIRVFFDKNHYNDWYFIYVTGMERGGLLKGPVNPNMPTGGNMGGLTPQQMNSGATGQPGQNGFGQGFGSGNTSPFGSSTFGSSGSSPGSSSPSPTPPQNQQQ